MENVLLVKHEGLGTLRGAEAAAEPIQSSVSAMIGPQNGGGHSGIIGTKSGTTEMRVLVNACSTEVRPNASARESVGYQIRGCDSQTRPLCQADFPAHLSCADLASFAALCRDLPT